MKLIIEITLILFLLVNMIFPQEKTDQMSVIKRSFNEFKYEDVIKQSNTVLGRQDSISDAQHIELLRMKATAHYVLEQEDMAVLSFVNILKTDPQYELDPVINSPKLISFFQNVRDNFKPVPVQKEADVQNRQTVFRPVVTQPKVSLWRSVLVPGWGHLHAGHKSKGGLLMGASIVTMAASAYLVAATADLEKEYLNKTVQDEIDKSYNKYNQYYRLRNGVLAAYALILLYAQLDLPSEVEIGSKQTLSFHPAFLRDNKYVSGLILRYSF